MSISRASYRRQFQPESRFHLGFTQDHWQKNYLCDRKKISFTFEYVEVISCEKILVIFCIKYVPSHVCFLCNPAKSIFEISICKKIYTFIQKSFKIKHSETILSKSNIQFTNICTMKNDESYPRLLKFHEYSGVLISHQNQLVVFLEMIC